MSYKKNKVFNKLFQLRKYFSKVTTLRHKMVRYFPNNLEEYNSDTVLEINKEVIIQEIDEHVSNITKRLHPTRKNIDGGLYVGITGVSFMFYYLARNPLLSNKKHLYLEKAQEYIKPALEASCGDKTSFLLGDAGTNALATALYRELGDDRLTASLKHFKSLYNLYLDSKFLRCGGDEFFVGRAGYLAGVLWLTRELQTPVFSTAELYKLCDVIVASGRDYAIRKKSPCPLMYHYYDTEYLGAAHGVSFILQMLLTVPGYIQKDKTVANDIKTTIEFIASLQTKEGNWPCCMEEVGSSDHKLVHWCHGAPGIIYLMAKAYLVFRDNNFHEACIRAGEIVWNKGLLRKGPGICHGVAGNGYVFLLLYRLTGDEKYIHRAKVFSEFMSSDEFLREARVPDNPESLYEGTAGTVCFLADLLVPDKAEFPFQDVFTTYN